MHYVGRYATSQSKLTRYLQRKVQERGWDEDSPKCDIASLTEDFVKLGYVDDAAFAESRARSLTTRGYGIGRVSTDLRVQGIAESDAAAALDQSEAEKWAAADHFARRKRIGPYANEAAAADKKQKQLQAFLRAGHGYDIAKKYVHAEPGEHVDQN